MVVLLAIAWVLLGLFINLWEYERKKNIALREVNKLLQDALDADVTHKVFLEKHTKLDNSNENQNSPDKNFIKQRFGSKF